MQMSKHGEEQPKHNKAEAQAFFHIMAEGFLSDGQS